MYGKKFHEALSLKIESCMTESTFSLSTFVKKQKAENNDHRTATNTPKSATQDQPMSS